MAGKRGPKPMPAKRKRNIQIGVRVNAAELREIEAAAGTIPPATWVRDVALRMARDEASRRK